MLVGIFQPQTGKIRQKTHKYANWAMKEMGMNTATIHIAAKIQT